MFLDTLLQIPFALTLSFYVLFPAFSLGLITFVTILEAIWLKTKNSYYQRIAEFWTKILFLTFIMGLITTAILDTEVVFSIPVLKHTLDNIIKIIPMSKIWLGLGVELIAVLVMVFGWKRVSPGLHFVATSLVFSGINMYVFLMLSFNSWMQAPSGVSFQDGVFIVNHWRDVIFNPVFFPRYLHMLLGTYAATSMVIAGIAGYYLLNSKHLSFARTCFSISMTVLLIILPLQFFVGDIVKSDVRYFQPIKNAAIQGVWDTQVNAPLVLFAIPNIQYETNDFEIHLSRSNNPVRGLKSFAPSERPNVSLVFWCFRLMVVFGLGMLVVAILGFFLRIQQKLFLTNWFFRVCIYLSPIGFLALIMGWLTSEFGRQPWIVNHYLRLLKTQSMVDLPHVFLSLMLGVLVYGIILGFLYGWYLLKIIKRGPGVYISELEETFFYKCD